MLSVVGYGGRKIAFITGRTYRKGNIADGNGVFPLAIRAVDFVDVRVFVPANIAVHDVLRVLKWRGCNICSTFCATASMTRRKLILHLNTTKIVPNFLGDR